MKTEDVVKKKYRLSLLYLLKDLLIAMIVGGIICLIFVCIIVYGVAGSKFVITEFIPDAIECFAAGMFLGLIFRCLTGGEDSGIGEVAGVTLYNTYAGIHNTFLFANAGGDYSFGAAASIIGLFITLLGFVYKVGCTIVVVPISFVYLCIMAVFETIFRGIPEGLGNFLDKLIPIIAKLGGILAVILVIILMNT